jgi:hypothetical protein
VRNLLAFIGGVVVVVAGLGYYRGWYKFESDNSHWTIEGNKQKVGADLETGKEILKEKAGQLLEKPATTSPTPPAQPGNGEQSRWLGPLAPAQQQPAAAPKWQPASPGPH